MAAKKKSGGKNEKSSKRLGKLASEALRDKRASKRERSLGGSVLTPDTR